MQQQVWYLRICFFKLSCKRCTSCAKKIQELVHQIHNTSYSLCAHTQISFPASLSMQAAAVLRWGPCHDPFDHSPRSCWNIEISQRRCAARVCSLILIELVNRSDFLRNLVDETLFIGCHSTVVAVPGWLAVAVQEPEKPVPSEHSRHRLWMIWVLQRAIAGKGIFKQGARYPQCTQRSASANVREGTSCFRDPTTAADKPDKDLKRIPKQPGS